MSQRKQRDNLNALLLGVLAFLFGSIGMPVFKSAFMELRTNSTAQLLQKPNDARQDANILKLQDTQDQHSVTLANLSSNDQVQDLKIDWHKEQLDKIVSGFELIADESRSTRAELKSLRDGYNESARYIEGWEPGRQLKLP